MTTWRAAGALLLVAVGVLVAVSGTDALITVAKTIAEYFDVVLLALALIVLVSLAAPKGTLRAPLILAAAGLIFLAARFDFWTPRNIQLTVGIGVAALGAWFILAHSRRPRDWTDPVQRMVAALRPNDLTVPVDCAAPRHLTVTAVGARAVVDLTKATWPANAPAIELAVNCLAGRVDLHVPSAWVVAAGRVHQTWGVQFAGQLDRAEPIEHVADVAPHRLASHTVVVHVIGAAGLVSLLGREQNQSAPPSSAGGASSVD